MDRVRASAHVLSFFSPLNKYIYIQVYENWRHSIILDSLIITTTSSQVT